MTAATTAKLARTGAATSVEARPAAPRRVRLAKALAATPTAKIPGMTRPPKQAGSNGKKLKKPKSGSNRYKLPDDEYARLGALKQRLELLGIPVRKSGLLRAGLLLLVAMNDVQLKKAVAGLVVGESAGHPQRAA